MKKTAKSFILAMCLLVFVMAIIAVSYQAKKINTLRKVRDLEYSEKVDIRLDQKRSFESKEDSMLWQLAVDREIMNRYLQEKTADKYRLRADSIALLLKDENMLVSIQVLEKSIGLKETASFLYNKFKPDYQAFYQQIINIDSLKESITKWEKAYLNLTLISSFNLEHEMRVLAKKNDDILWLSRYGNFSNDDLLSFAKNPSAMISYAYYQSFISTAEPSSIIDMIDSIIDMIDIECLADRKYRELGVLLSPNRYLEVVKYLEDRCLDNTLDYIRLTSGSRDLIKEIFDRNFEEIGVRGLKRYVYFGYINKDDARAYLYLMSCEKLITPFLTYQKPEFSTILKNSLIKFGIDDYAPIVINSIKNKNDVLLAEQFFLHHSNLYEDRQFIRKQLEEKWESF